MYMYFSNTKHVLFALIVCWCCFAVKPKAWKTLTELYGITATLQARSKLRRNITDLQMTDIQTYMVDTKMINHPWLSANVCKMHYQRCLVKLLIIG